MRPGLRRLAAAALALLCGCGQEIEGTPWAWNLPAGFPLPHVPADNPMTVEKVELGRHLFYDERLSADLSMSCATCHQQHLAFTDGLARPVGLTGQVHPRSSMSLANVAYAATLNWANPLTLELERQALGPLLGTLPIVELGMEGREQELLTRLRADPELLTRFAAAFPTDPELVTLTQITRALASFQRTLISGDSPYDRARHGGDASAMSDSAKRGEALFFSERLECFHCHEGFNFSASTFTARSPGRTAAFFNTGLYNLDGAGAYPASDPGVIEVTDDPRDMGRFKPPTLRNIAITGPYMHDGSIATLEEVLVSHYGRAGRKLEGGPDAGDGATSPLKNGFVVGFTLTDAERADVLAFLESLTDETFLTDPALADPRTGP